VVQALFRRAQLKAMVDIHGVDYGLGGDLSEDEITVIRGALDLSNKTALTCMTPLDKVCAFLLKAPSSLLKTEGFQEHALT
jgi:CBS domain containing-hemolysin-like protein